MAKEDEEDIERLQNGMSVSNLADRLKAQIIRGTAIPLKPESETPPPEKSAEESLKQ